MKVYFINPPADRGVKQVREGRCMQRAGAWTAVWSPISLATCAALVREEGFEVKVTDCIVEEVDLAGLEKLAADFQPGLAVFNVATPSIESDMRAVERVKQVVPGLVTAVLGIHPTALPEHCFDLAQGLDAAVRMEPEYTVLELAKRAGSGGDLASVAGTSARAGESVVHNPDRPLAEDLDRLPFPAWDLVDTGLYTMPFTGKRFLLVGTARGCPFQCTFCADSAYYGKKLRMRSPGSIVSEMERNIAEFGVEDFLFWSESFTLNREFAVAVAQEIMHRGVKASWVCNSRVDHVDGELLRLFKAAGCTMVGYGVESGVQRVLDRAKKGVTVEQTRKAVKATRAAGLDVVAHCVLGLPGETGETVRETIEFVKHLDLDFAQFYCAVPFPGSELYGEASGEGWISTGDWSMFEQNYSVLDTPGLAADEVMRLRRVAYREFYLRPRVILRTLARLRTWRQVAGFARMTKDFLTWV